MKKKEFDLSLVSKYRTELMGFAIIGVLIMHLVSIGQVTRTMPIKAISLVPTMAFTETFLLLSGLGIVHSLQSRPTIVNYYKKRIKRLVIPYILMAFIPILLYVYLAKEQFIMYPYRLSTIDFWMGDGCLGMWYIAVTVFLYIIAPWLYSFQFFERKSRFLVLLGGAILFLSVIYMTCPSYWASTGVWLAQTLAFFIGGYVMTMINHNKKLSMVVLLEVVLMTIILITVALKIPFVTPFSRITIRICGVVILCYMFKYIVIEERTIIRNVFRWFGNYSLELYLLHMLLYQPLKFVESVQPFYLILLSVLLSILLCKPVHLLTQKL